MLCLGKIEIGLACVAAGLILECCFLEEHRLFFFFYFLFHKTPFVLYTLLDCATLNAFVFITEGVPG